MSHTVPIRRTTAGVGLIGFPIAGFVAALIDADEGTETTGADLYRIVVEHGDAIRLSALIFMLSAVLTIPAAMATLHLVRGRGSTLVQIGATLMVLGGFGHMGFATWQLMISRVAAGSTDEPALVSYLDREQSLMSPVLLPLLIAIGVGLLLVVIGMHRAGVVDRWFLIAMVVLFVYDLVLNSSSLEDSKVAIVAVWAVLAVLFGVLGVRVLRMSDGAWSNDPVAVG